MNNSNFQPGISGGRKNMWLRENWRLVTDFYHEFGFDATLKQFTMKPDTLERFLDREGIEKKDIRLEKLNLMAQMAIEGANEARRDVRELKGEYKHFTELVGQQLIEKFFVPVLRSAIKLPPELEEMQKPDLDITDLKGVTGYERD